MVDYQSRYRLYSLGYTSPTPRDSVHTHRQLKHDANRSLYRKQGDRPVHDCRPEFAREMTDRRDWEGRLLTRGLRETYDNLDNLHRKDAPKPTGKRDPDKMLLSSGQLGTRSGDFHFPRGLICTSRGDIVVADSQNHRVQVLNQAGLYKTKFGAKGCDPGQFNEPVAVCELPNELIAVADRRNKRIQVFSIDGAFKHSFPTGSQPYSVACDKFYNIMVATTSRRIEVYGRSGKLQHAFKLGGKSTSSCPVQIATNNKEEIIVCDPLNANITCYTLNGQLLYKFEPVACGNGLTVLPSGICVNLLGELLVSDSLNHTVNLYSDRGILIRQLVTPVDAAGSIHSIAVGPEGHLVTTECSVKGDHCVKIFRYMQCQCHQTRPPSSRKRTPLHFLDF